MIARDINLPTPRGRETYRQERALVSELALATLRLPRFIDASALPDLAARSAPDQPLPRQATLGLVRRLLDTREAQGDAVFERARRLLDPRTTDALARELYLAWDVTQRHGGYPWIRRAIAWFGGDRVALEIATELARWSSQGSTRRRQMAFLMDALVEIGTNTALMILMDMARTQHATRIQRRAMNLTRDAARRRAVSVERLEDLATPWCGFDARGRRAFTTPRGALEAALDEHFEVVWRGPGRLEGAPALEEWSHIESMLEEAARLQTLRMEQAMVTGRRWARGAWMKSFLDHPLMINYARRLVWGVFDADDDLVATFRATEDRELVTVDDDAFVIPAGLRVGLVHPLHLERGLRAAWSQSFGDYEIFSPIEQLNRRTYSPPGDRFDDVEFDERAFREVMKRERWRYDAAANTGKQVYRDFGRGARVTLRMDMWLSSWREPMGAATFEGLDVLAPEGARREIAVSETVRALEEVLCQAPSRARS